MINTTIKVVHTLSILISVVLTCYGYQYIQLYFCENISKFKSIGEIFDIPVSVILIYVAFIVIFAIMRLIFKYPIRFLLNKSHIINISGKNFSLGKRESSPNDALLSINPLILIRSIYSMTDLLSLYFLKYNFSLDKKEFNFFSSKKTNSPKDVNYKNLLKIDNDILYLRR